MSSQSPSSSERRSFLTYVNSRVTALAALAAGGAALSQAKSKDVKRWEPTRHDKDDWWDEMPGKHRLVFDTISADGFGEALAFASNYIRVNRVDYGVPENELAVVIVARHRSTPYAYNDAMWAKYGGPISEQAMIEDPKTKMPPKINMYNSSDYGRLLSNRGTTVDSLIKQNLHFAVCSSATHAFSGTIAKATGAKADDIFTELTSNLVPNARMVPAGIVAVSRAQERGYTLVKS